MSEIVNYWKKVRKTFGLYFLKQADHILEIPRLKEFWVCGGGAMHVYLKKNIAISISEKQL